MNDFILNPIKIHKFKFQKIANSVRQNKSMTENFSCIIYNG